MRIPDAVFAKVERERVSIPPSPDIVWHKETTPELAADEVWAIYTKLQSMIGEGNNVVTYGGKDVHQPDEIAGYLSRAEIYLFDSNVLAHNTRACDPERAYKKWIGKTVTYEQLPLTPIFLIMTTGNMKMKDLDFVSAEHPKEAKQIDFLVSSMLVRTERVLLTNLRDEVIGLRCYLFAIDPKTGAFMVSTQPLVTTHSEGRINGQAVNVTVRARSQAIALEMLEFASSKITERRESDVEPEQVFRATKMVGRKNLFIPTIQTIILREKEVIRDIPITHEYTGRDIEYSQSVREHWRTLRSGKVIAVRAHRRYEDLPPRPQPNAVVHVVNR